MKHSWEKKAMGWDLTYKGANNYNQQILRTQASKKRAK